jgi:ACR3 family arsenite efflux pump ArsB
MDFSGYDSRVALGYFVLVKELIDKFQVGHIDSYAIGLILMMFPRWQRSNMTNFTVFKNTKVPFFTLCRTGLQGRFLCLFLQ